MAEISRLRGVWIYRSFLNAPSVVGDFNKLAVWEAELSLDVSEDGRLYGYLAERPSTTTGAEPYLHVEGEVRLGNPTEVRWRATGRLASEYDGWVYDYLGHLTPEWTDALRPRTAITGTVIRTVTHGTAPAGSVFSFVAVKCDFVEPRVVIALAKPVTDIMASVEHRHHHALWHASRNEWVNLSDAKKEALRSLGWQPGLSGAERPSLSSDRTTNGSGEDFFFMHRRMVRDVRALDPNVGTWKRLPQPQFPASFDAGVKAVQIGNLDGNAVPSAWIVPGDPSTTAWLVELRKTSTLYSKLQVWEAQYTDSEYLASISLGELGSRIEFTIHNWMHMRWASVTRDPSTDKTKQGVALPTGRAPLDFDAKWTDPQYDYLGETFSSHVNPIFWRLHGWVDDRIEDWYRAHETVRPGVIKRKQVDSVEWFEADGRWVLHARPWEGPVDPHAAHSPGHGHGGLALDVPTMQKALRVIFGPEPSATPADLEAAAHQSGRSMATWFKRVED